MGYVTVKFVEVLQGLGEIFNMTLGAPVYN
jgi:hypothetical protein